jgi:PAS domain S-box-containing protein
VDRKRGTPIFDILAGTPDGVFAVDCRQRIVFWNDAARRILSFEPESVLGRSCYNVIGGTDESGCAVCEKGCAMFKASVRRELSPTKDVQVSTEGGGRKWINVTTFRLPSRWHQFFLLAHVFRDANHVKQLEYRLEQALNETPPPPSSQVAPRPLAPLTRREGEVLYLLASGVSTASICAALRIQTTTVRTHVQRILQKLGVHSRLEAIASASQNGLLDPPAD